VYGSLDPVSGRTVVLGWIAIGWFAVDLGVLGYLARAGRRR
jgi:hypothetical protein